MNASPKSKYITSMKYNESNRPNSAPIFGKENLDPNAESITPTRALPLSATEATIKTQSEKISKYQRVLHNVKRVEKRLIFANVKLLESNCALERSNGLLAKEVDQMAVTTAATHRLKSRGTITATARAITQQLLAAGVADTQVTTVIKTVTAGFGQTISGKISRRSVNRIGIEAGVAAKVQLANELVSAKSFTGSSDGTSNKNLEYTSHHIALLAPDYSDPSTAPKLQVRFLGLSGDVDHTAETQLEGWQDLLKEIYETLRSSPQGQEIAVEFEEVIQKLTGMNTDHAEDQKKLVRLIKEWKLLCSHIAEGKKIVAASKASSVNDVLPLLEEVNNEMIETAGGSFAFQMLSPVDQQKREDKAYLTACTRMGKAAFVKLSDTDKRAILLFFWAGCCMHKEMNTVKGGNAAMKAHWPLEGLLGPEILANKDNDAARNIDPHGPAGIRAKEVSEGGAVKACSIAGVLFNHKDKKKGLQDTFHIFFEKQLGKALRFPDTSNTRFQCYCMASAVLIAHLDMFISFLDLVRFKKESRSFNHMEFNLHKALKCEFTITEFCVLVLYSQAISHPYMRRVWSTKESEQNILDLGPYHSSVMEHIRSIIENTDLLLSPTASHTSGALDGLEWEDATAFKAVQDWIPKLPYIKGALLAFFSGALETWESFLAEFAPGGDIQTATTEEKELGAMPNTNDRNEGKLGRMRQILKHAPNMSLGRLNALEMYCTNGTEDYIKTASPEMIKFFREEAHRLDSSGTERLRREKIAEHDQAKADRGVISAEASAQRKAAQNAKLQLIRPILDVGQLAKTTKADMIRQMQWYRKNGKGRKIPPYSSLGKDALRATLIDVINRHLQVTGPSLEDEGEVISLSPIAVLGDSGLTVVVEDEEADELDDDCLYYN